MKSNNGEGYTITGKSPQAHALEVMARALPKMIEARAKSQTIKPGEPGQLGDIAEKVANFLGVEVCTIFLMQNEATGRRLVLAEAYGYEKEAIGKSKSLDKGITARIAGCVRGQEGSDLKAVVCNFTVQDHPKWAGQLDGELPRHGWTMLGIPIVGADGKPKGVIKLENKKSESHSDQVSGLLSAMASRVNTPKTILNDVRNLLDETEGLGATGGRCRVIVTSREKALLEKVVNIAEKIQQACQELSADIPFVPIEDWELQTATDKEGNSPGQSADVSPRRNEAHITGRGLNEAWQTELMEKLELQVTSLATSLRVLHQALARSGGPGAAVFLRGSPRFTVNSFLNTASFTDKLREHADKTSSFLWSQLSAESQAMLLKTDETVIAEQGTRLLEELNSFLQNGEIDCDEVVKHVEISRDTKSLLNQCLGCPKRSQGACLVRIKRLLLEDAYPEYIARNSLHSTLESFLLAIQTYVPFSRSDVLMVRAATAIIAAAIDISENTSAIALHQLEHGLRKGTRHFLESIRELTAASSRVTNGEQEALRDGLKALWLTALNISGPNDAFGARDTETTKFGEFLSTDLESRFSDYRDCAVVWNKGLSVPEDGASKWGSLLDTPLGCSKHLILGVCDILFCNAVEWGGAHVRIRLEHNAAHARIIFEDNGKGIDPIIVKGLEHPSPTHSRNARFGLHAARYALLEKGCDLLILENRNTGGNWTSLAITIPVRSCKPFNTGATL